MSRAVWVVWFFRGGKRPVFTGPRRADCDDFMRRFPGERHEIVRYVPAPTKPTKKRKRKAKR